MNESRKQKLTIISQAMTLTREPAGVLSAAYGMGGFHFKFIDQTEVTIPCDIPPGKAKIITGMIQNNKNSNIELNLNNPANPIQIKS